MEFAIFLAGYCALFPADPQMMEKFHVSPREFMIVENINLRKATFVKLKFRDGTFGELSNPRAM